MKIPKIKDPCTLCGNNLLPRNTDIFRCNTCKIEYMPNNIYVYSNFCDGWIYWINVNKLIVVGGRAHDLMKTVFTIECDTDLKEIINKIHKLEIFS